jgi:hypothetical protein
LIHHVRSFSRFLCLSSSDLLLVLRKHILALLVLAGLVALALGQTVVVTTPVAVTNANSTPLTSQAATLLTNRL